MCIDDEGKQINLYGFKKISGGYSYKFIDDSTKPEVSGVFEENEWSGNLYYEDALVNIGTINSYVLDGEKCTFIDNGDEYVGKFTNGRMESGNKNGKVYDQQLTLMVNEQHFQGG